MILNMEFQGTILPHKCSQELSNINSKQVKHCSKCLYPRGRFSEGFPDYDSISLQARESKHQITMQIMFFENSNQSHGTRRRLFTLGKDLGFTIFHIRLLCFFLHSV